MVDIKGFEGLYAITEDGQVWSYYLNDYKAQFDNGHGYMCVKLSKDGQVKNKRVNRLVAEAYLDNPDGLPDVAHKDNNTFNNNVSNLYWTTRRENIDTDSFREKQRVKIFSKVKCVETGEIFESQAAAARAYGIHKYGINNVLMGKQQTAAGYHWVRIYD